MKGGFQEIDIWRSCYIHPVLQLLLVVYVDDFKMAGPTSSLAEGWRIVRRHVRTETPTALDKYLGCQHRMYDVPKSAFSAEARELFQWPPAPIPVKEKGPKNKNAPAPVGGGFCFGTRAKAQ